MNSVTSRRFRDCLAGLPDHVQRLAVEAYAMWAADPHHRSLEFKRVALGRRSIPFASDCIGALSA